MPGRLAQFGDASWHRRSSAAAGRLRAGQCLACTLAWCGAGVVGILAIISFAASSAPAIICGMSEASGRFRQYFFGISACIAFTFSRAGLKMFWK